MKPLRIFPYRYRHRFDTYWHNRAIMRILKTPPLRQAETGLVFLSMLRHSDILMYLVAIKPIYHRLGPGLISIIDDGSLTLDDRRLLKEHLGSVRFLKIDEIHTGHCPRGGCWERLLSVLDFAIDNYVIQVDADIVALGTLEEVANCIKDNRAFTLAGHASSTLEYVGDTSARTRKQHIGALTVQPAAEQLLDRMPGAASFKYIFGTAAFTGFPRGSGGHDEVARLSCWMEARLGPLWQTWGSEQVASNFLIANASDPLVLPWRKYQCYHPPEYSLGTDLNHFFGTFRFDRGAYRAQSHHALSMLSEALV